MFSEEEWKFIKNLLKDELYRYSIHRDNIKDDEKMKEFNNQIKAKEDFIRGIINKIIV